MTIINLLWIVPLLYSSCILYIQDNVNSNALKLYYTNIKVYQDVMYQHSSANSSYNQLLWRLQLIIVEIKRLSITYQSFLILVHAYGVRCLTSFRSATANMAPEYKTQRAPICSEIRIEM